MCNTAYYNEALPMQGGEVSIVSSIAFFTSWLDCCLWLRYSPTSLIYEISKGKRPLKPSLDH